MKLSVAMTRRETLLGWIFLPVSLFILPGLIGILNARLAEPLSDTIINILYFALNFLGVALIFHRFLLSSIQKAWQNRWKCLRFAALGFLFYYIAMLMISYGIMKFYPDFSNVNDATIMALAEEHRTLMTFCTVLLVPVAEETLYRGLFFQGLHHRSRLLAYSISTLMFASIHVFGYIGLFDGTTLLLCFLQYLPAGLCLAWAYTKADTIFAPILIHTIINAVSIGLVK